MYFFISDIFFYVSDSNVANYATTRHLIQLKRDDERTKNYFEKEADIIQHCF